MESFGCGALLGSFQIPRKALVVEPKGPHAPNCAPKRPGALLGLLRRLPPRTRRALLEGFTERQRRSLERCLLRRLPVLAPRLQRAPRSGVRGIEAHCRSGRTLYRASASAGPFRVTSGYFPELHSAQQVLGVLRRISARVGAASQARGALVEAFREALEEEPRAAALDLSGSFRLRFFSVVSMGGLVGALRTPLLPVTGEGLDRGLAAWRRLDAARDFLRGPPLAFHSEVGHRREAWRRLRRAYTEAWAASGACAARQHRRLERLDRALHTSLAHLGQREAEARRMRALAQGAEDIGDGRQLEPHPSAETGR